MPGDCCQLGVPLSWSHPLMLRCRDPTARNGAFHWAMSAADVEPGSLTSLLNFVRPFRVRVTSTSGGAHVPTSYHYRYRAVDCTGTRAEMERLHAAALKHPQSFREGV